MGTLMSEEPRTPEYDVLFLGGADLTISPSCKTS
jgi:hypothetical protein